VHPSKFFSWKGGGIRNEKKDPNKNSKKKVGQRVLRDPNKVMGGEGPPRQRKKKKKKCGN